MFGPGYFEDRADPDKYQVFGGSGSTNVLLHKRVVHLSPGANSTCTAVMPNVSEARGREYLIHAMSLGNTTSRAALDYSDGTAAGNTTGMATAGVQILLKSNGVEWFVERS